ncbi:hypothetical protein [Deinococcus hopiensis]|uniref:hypothetical protein n=1 Tax=Deinococcus hopiensis TaxID=309885 RepID=UPI0014837C7F|nr:hypothetical protein [Deinococcus hopiensis]
MTASLVPVPQIQQPVVPSSHREARFIRSQNVIVDRAQRTILHNGARLYITEQEVALLSLLMQRPGSLYSLKDIQQVIALECPHIETVSLRHCMSRLQLKLEVFGLRQWIRCHPDYGCGVSS